MKGFLMNCPSPLWRRRRRSPPTSHSIVPAARPPPPTPPPPFPIFPPLAGGAPSPRGECCGHSSVKKLSSFSLLPSRNPLFLFLFLSSFLALCASSPPLLLHLSSSLLASAADFVLYPCLSTLGAWCCSGGGWRGKKGTGEKKEKKWRMGE